MSIADSEDAAPLAAAQSAIALDPTKAEAWNTLGAVHIQRGELEASRDCFSRAVELDPGFIKALNNLAVVLQHLGDLAAAEAHYRQALRNAPDHPDILFNFAALLGVTGRYAQALACVDQLIVQSPGLVRAHLLAADLERDFSRPLAALQVLDKVLSTDPDRVEALGRRAHILCRLDRWGAALIDCEHALNLAPADPDALYMRAQALQGLGLSARALDAFDVAEAASPAPARVLTGKAVLLSELGRKAEALATLDRALIRRPDLAEAWYSRANLTRYAPGDSDLAAMEALVDRPGATFHDRVHLNFALGKAYLAQGDGARAFARLGLGNALKRESLGYDPGADAGLIDKIAATFSAEALASLGGMGDASALPIFVIGMPRSGTTLVEQILASHPLVHGAGEPPYMAEIAEASGFPMGPGRLEAADFAALGGRYLDLIGADAAEVRHVVDKLPSNFLYAGLIALILPRARMIHCRRDPLDTCLSCYSLLFTRGHEYAYDLDELGRFYGLYRRLMTHWRKVLPASVMLDFDYEALIAEPEAQIRRLLAFCGLPWDEACLRFHETPRRVSSSSLTQVRSPLYSSSVGRAQDFRAWLGPLETALAQAGIS